MKTLLDRLRRSGTVIEPAGRDPDELLLKGSVWTLHIEPGRDPCVVELRHTVPRAVRACAAHAGAGSS